MSKDPLSKGFSLQHELFVVDASLSVPLDEGGKEAIASSLVKALLASLGMKELGPLQVYPATDLRAPGWTFLQPITTSHISGHYFVWPAGEPNIHIDIYSCASVNWRRAMVVLSRLLPLANWKATFVRRTWGHDGRQTLEITGLGATVLSEIPLQGHENAPAQRLRVLDGIDLTVPAYR